jgi:hypothetical protein
MPTRVLSVLIAIGATVAVLILSWPQLFGLQNTWVVAHVVSLRGLAVVGAAGLLVVLLLLMPSVRFAAGRHPGGHHRAFGVTNVAILASGASTAPGRGTRRVAATDAGDTVTVLSWNTWRRPGAAEIAKLALEQDTDIITLPETTEETGASRSHERGRTADVGAHGRLRPGSKACSTLLISPELGEYAVSRPRARPARQHQRFPPSSPNPSTATA